jgi:hypothetical protein
MRGTSAPEGATRLAPNGYQYTKKDGKWRLTHHLIAEKNSGRKLNGDDGVYFIDGDRTNLTPENIGVRKKKTPNLRARRAVIVARIEELQAELDDIDSKLSATV